MAPMVNHTMATAMRGLRPKISDREEKTGWKTGFVSFIVQGCRVWFADRLSRV